MNGVACTLRSIIPLLDPFRQFSGSRPEEMLSFPWVPTVTLRLERERSLEPHSVCTCASLQRNFRPRVTQSRG